jgi:hypothetical protein
MDAAFTLEGLITEFQDLLSAGDREGAEELLASALGRDSAADAHLHLQFGRLYRDWNKLTSAVNHLHMAAELAAATDRLLLLQITDELKAVRRRQSLQTP